MRRALTIGLAILAGSAAACGRQYSPTEPSGATWSPPMPSTSGVPATATDRALLRWMAANGATHGAYFLPAESVDEQGNRTFAGTSRVFVSQALDDGGTLLCTMEAISRQGFFRIGPRGVMDHVNSAATLTYQHFGPGVMLLEELTGEGRMNVQIQGELDIVISDEENGESFTFLNVGARSSAETIAGGGKVGPAGGRATRDLRCGLRADARGGSAKTFVELR